MGERERAALCHAIFLIILKHSNVHLLLRKNGVCRGGWFGAIVKRFHMGWREELLLGALSAAKLAVLIGATLKLSSVCYATAC